MHPCSLCAALLAAAPLLSAAPLSSCQGEAEGGEPPLFLLATAQQRVLEFAGAMVAHKPHGWQLAAGGHGEVTIASDLLVRQLEVASALPEDLLVEVAVRPSAWMTSCPDDVAAFAKAWGTRLVVLAGQTGLTPQASKELLPALLAVATDVEAARLTVRRSGPAAVLALLTVTPKAGTALHRWLQLLMPGKQEVPAIASDDDAIGLRFDIAPDRLPGLFDPFVPWFAAMTSGASEQALADSRRALAAMDGSGAIAMGKGGMRIVFGLREPKTFAEVSFAPASLERSKAHLARRRIDAEYTVGALVHRDVPSLKTSMLVDQPVPMLGNDDGEVTGFVAIAGAAAVTVTGGPRPEQRIKDLIDAALDGKLPHRPLAAVATAAGTAADPFLTFDLDLPNLFAALPESLRSRAPAADSFPRRIHVSLHQTGTSLEIRTILQ